jgi:hypothetical protein
MASRPPETAICLMINGTRQPDQIPAYLRHRAQSLIAASESVGRNTAEREAGQKHGR